MNCFLGTRSSSSANSFGSPVQCGEGAPRSQGRARLLSSHSRHAAFTLLELLLGTAIGAVVLVVIQTTFFGALRLHNTTHARLESDLVVHRALSIVQRDFAGITLPGTALSGQLQSTNFSSLTTGNYGERVTPDLFTSSGKIDGWSQFSELQMVAYYLAPAASGEVGQNLVRVVTRNLLPAHETEPDQQVILHGVASATLEFYDRVGWTDTWDSEVTETLPSALKLSVVMAARSPGEREAAPIELIVPIMVTTTTSQAEAAEEEALLP